MGFKAIDPSRVQELLYQDVKPVNISEKCLIIAFERGKIGDLMSNLIDNFPIEYTTLNELQKDFLLIGYALGQNYYIDIENKKCFNGNKQ